MTETTTSPAGPQNPALGVPSDPVGEPTGVLPPYVAPHDPWAPPPPPPSAPGRVTGPERRRPGRGVATLVAVALAAGLVGGGAGAALTATVDRPTPATATSLGAPNAPVSAPAPAAGSVAEVASKVLPSVVSITVQTNRGGDTGSGIVLTADGFVLTNNHVVSAAAGGGQITVTLNDGRSVAARIVGRDPVSDLAVLKADGVSGLAPAALGNSSALAVGDTVVAVGSPLGLSGTVTSGIVSALHRPVSTSGGNGVSGAFEAIQTDAPINPGNSGGPLVNLSGQVVGINSAIASLGASAGGQAGSIGLGFAIPIDVARPIVDQLMKGQPARHAELGVQVGDATKAGVPSGALLGAVAPGSPAAQAGLQPGDVIVALDGQRIDSSEALVAAVRARQPGTKVSLTITRGGSTRTVTVTLGVAAATTG